jgi:hypothetical protein
MKKLRLLRNLCQETQNRDLQRDNMMYQFSDRYGERRTARCSRSRVGVRNYSRSVSRFKRNGALTWVIQSGSTKDSYTRNLTSRASISVSRYYIWGASVSRRPH